MMLQSEAKLSRQLVNLPVPELKGNVADFVTCLKLFPSAKSIPLSQMVCNRHPSSISLSFFHSFMRLSFVNERLAGPAVNNSVRFCDLDENS